MEKYNMFLKKPSPLSLRVKSKYSDLFLLRKHEAMLISKSYPNVWKKIYLKSYHNMKSIKKITQKLVIHYCSNYGHKYDTIKGFQILEGNPDQSFLTEFELLNQKNRDNRETISFNIDENNNINANSNNFFPKPQKRIIKDKIEILKHIEKNRRDTFEEKSINVNTNNELNDTEANKNFLFQMNGIQINNINTFSPFENDNDIYNNKNDFSITSGIHNNISLKNQLLANNNNLINNQI